MAPRMIEGEVEDPESEIVRLLERELAEVRRELAQERADASHREGQALRAVKELRRQLLPMYRAFQAVFGELDAVVSDAEDARETAPGAGDRVRSVWDSWIQKFGPGSTSGRFILALLDHGALSAKQMKVVAKMADQTVYDTARKLSGLGLLVKNGSKYSLKQL